MASGDGRDVPGDGGAAGELQGQDLRLQDWPCRGSRLTGETLTPAPAGWWWTHGLPRTVGGRVFATEPRRQRASRPPRPPGTSSSARPSPRRRPPSRTTCRRRGGLTDPPAAPRSASRSSTTAAPPAARADAPQGAALESAPDVEFLDIGRRVLRTGSRDDYRRTSCTRRSAAPLSTIPSP